MGFFHIIGILIGASLMGAAKYLWVEVCIVVADFSPGLDSVTCNGFGNFFFYFGIFSLVISLIGFFRHRHLNG